MDEPVLTDIQEGLVDLVARGHERFLNCSDLTLEEAEQLGSVLATLQRDIMFWCGDLARYTEARWPDTHHQAWPEWVSPGLLARTAGVCRQYPKQSDRQAQCTYAQYMQVSGKADRQSLLEEMQGETTDESRTRQKAELSHADTLVPGSTPGRAGASSTSAPTQRWLLAVDVNYHLTRVWASGAGQEAAMTVSQWVRRTVDRLQKDLGLTDVVCCCDSKESFRKDLTADWEDGYKPRALKDSEHAAQLQLVEELLAKEGFRCVKQDGFEADDLLASYAKQFEGRVTLFTMDKDMRQCLSGTCNMLTDIEWREDETSGQALPDYQWVTAKSHFEGMTYNNTRVEEIRPEQWAEFQTLAGDSVDGISGAVGIGPKIAATLLKEFGTAEAAIQAAKDDDPRITPAKRKALVEFEGKLEITRKLVTLRDDLTIPNDTRI